MRLFTTSPCHVTKIGNKTANINAKKHSLSHQSTAQLHIENSKNKNGDKAFAVVDIQVICCNSVITIFYFCCFRCVIVPLTGVINYVFCIYIQAQMLFFIHVHIQRIQQFTQSDVLYIIHITTTTLTTVCQKLALRAAKHTHRHRTPPPVGRSVYMDFKGVRRTIIQS